jgi:hypothetical protein
VADQREALKLKRIEKFAIVKQVILDPIALSKFIRAVATRMGGRDKPVVPSQRQMKRHEVGGHAMNISKPMQIDDWRTRAGFDEGDLSPPYVDLVPDGIHGHSQFQIALIVRPVVSAGPSPG